MADGFLDRQLRSRISKTLLGFDQALAAATTAQPTPDALDELGEATDQLMRAAARLLLELSRYRGNGHA